MTTATKTMAPLDTARGERARKARLSEAHVLAAAIFDYYAEGNAPLDYVAGPRAGASVTKDDRADYQKALILDWADRLGFPVHSRKELTAEQLGRICTALRARMQELGIPEPEQNRPPERATADQYRRLYKVIDKVERLAGWGGRQHTLNFIHRQTGRRAWPVRGLTRSQAEAIERGLDGVLRHTRRNP